jgi:radical SAM protein with 4Fe4S-binding SPASM domain
MLFWESTWKCNLACKHCRRLDAPQNETDELTTSEMCKVLDSVSTLGKPVVVFSGGEPLLRDDWEELATYAKSLGLPTALATNGTLITPELSRRIAPAFRRVAVSLDGIDSKTHDTFRGASGAFEAALAGIAALRAENVDVQINVTVTTHNADQLDAIYALAEDTGAMGIHMFLLVPVGCGAEIPVSQQLTAQRYEQTLNWICNRQEVGPLEIRATCAPHYYRVAVQRGMDISRSRGCLAGISVAFISHSGEVFPCGYLPVSCGSVKTQKFADIWNSSEVFDDLRDYSKLTGKCGCCRFVQICGGCRARAYATTGDYLSEEPFCMEPLGGGTDKNP